MVLHMVVQLVHQLVDHLADRKGVMKVEKMVLISVGTMAELMATYMVVKKAV